MAIEKTTVTFQNGDGRVIVINAENNLETNETNLQTNFGHAGPESHDGGMHSDLYLKLMYAIRPFSLDCSVPEQAGRNPEEQLDLEMEVENLSEENRRLTVRIQELMKGE